MRLEQRALPADFRAGVLGLPAALERVYAARGVSTPEALALNFSHLHPPQGFSGMAAALTLLLEARARQLRILVVGDFDADGATASAVAVRALRMLGFAHVDFRVPNRFLHGYGLTPSLVEELSALEPDILLTVDNGTSSVAGVALAVKLGMRVLVTDHHLPGAELPAATAIVNPNLPGEHFPSRNLSGVGTVFYMLLALRARLRELGELPAQGGPNLAELLDLVALGTVADLVPLDRNNRILVEQGLRRLRAGLGTPGVRALLAVSGLDPARVSSIDLAFRIGPRLNAAGRLEDMAIGIECLLTDDLARARELAEQLSELNKQRRELQDHMQREAFAQLDKLAPARAGPPLGIVLAQAQWHQGIVGLVASKLVEQNQRPAVAFAPCDEGWRGSARSIPGLHLRDVLADVDAQNPGLIIRFGGHAMAAGLTLAEPDIERFRTAFVAALAPKLDAELLDQVLLHDGTLQAGEFNLELAQAIKLAGPWGQHFPEPLFAIDAEVLDASTLSGRHLKLRLSWPGVSSCVALWFNAPLSSAALPARANWLVQVDVDDYRGVYAAKLIVRQMLS